MHIKILIVDDSASDRLIIKNILSEYCILTACDGREAMRVLEEHDGINLLILDLNMPNMNGLQYSQNLIKKAGEALSQHCTDNRLLFQSCENRFIFYLLDYKDKNELIDFSDVITDTLESLFVTERIDGGIGILEIEQNQNEIDIDLLLRRLLIASERALGLFGKYFQTCFYNEEIESLVNRERDIVEALNVIAADDYTNNHLFLQYQPIVSLRTGSISGFEALARLRTEKLGLVSPLEFIPVYEESLNRSLRRRKMEIFKNSNCIERRFNTCKY